jgi:sodium/bile acid cotransporter 7
MTFTRLVGRLDPYIVAMFATVALAAVLPAQGRGAVVAGAAADFAIAALFFLYGARLSTAAVLGGLRQWQLHLAVLATTFLVFPVLGLALERLLPGALPAPLYAGLLFLCVLPSTVQSSIAFTAIARGNVAAALCAASASNLIGIAVSPVLAGWLLHTQGVTLSPGVFRDICLQLLLPFVAGHLLRRWIGDFVQAQKRLLGLVDRGAILLIIYVAFSKGMTERIWAQLSSADLAVLLLVLALLLALILGITTLAARRILKLTIQDEIVLVFCGSKKSLASGLPIASILFAGPQLGAVVLPVMLFHQLQLVVCAWLARRYAARAEPTADAPAPREA